METARVGILIIVLMLFSTLLTLPAVAAVEITYSKLSSTDVQKAFEKEVNGKGFRNSLIINQFIGVHQDGNSATVLYLYSGVERSEGKSFEDLAQDKCYKLNDDRWFCIIENPPTKFYAYFFLPK